MVRFISPQKAEIDIHNMRYDEAKRYLERFLSTANGNVREITVIHGYSSGNVLQQMVRKKLKHRRIKRKVISGNPGITILLL